MSFGLFISLFVIACGSVLHGLTGMGFPMIATPALASSLPLTTALALLALPTLILNAKVVFSKPKAQTPKSTPKNTPNHQPPTAQHPQAINTLTLLKRYWLLALTSVIGSVLGVWLLFVLPTAYIGLMMAAVILYYATQGLLSLHGLVRPLTVPTGRLSMAGFGLGSGLIGGATNAMSPILLMYLLSKTDDKDEIAIASNLCYLLAKVVQILLLWQEFARFDVKLWTLMAIITVFSLIGLSFGTALRPKISQLLFKRLIYIILLVLGLKIAHSNLVPFFA